MDGIIAVQCNGPSRPGHEALAIIECNSSGKHYGQGLDHQQSDLPFQHHVAASDEEKPSERHPLVPR